jgi:hypothetical protein
MQDPAYCTVHAAPIGAGRCPRETRNLHALPGVRTCITLLTSRTATGASCPLFSSQVLLASLHSMCCASLCRWCLTLICELQQAPAATTYTERQPHLTTAAAAERGIHTPLAGAQLCDGGSTRVRVLSDTKRRSGQEPSKAQGLKPLYWVRLLHACLLASG